MFKFTHSYKAQSVSFMIVHMVSFDCRKTMDTLKFTLVITQAPPTRSPAVRRHASVNVTNKLKSHDEYKFMLPGHRSLSPLEPAAMPMDVHKKVRHNIGVKCMNAMASSPYMLSRLPHRTFKPRVKCGLYHFVYIFKIYIVSPLERLQVII
jgi:hypothetical protein